MWEGRSGARGFGNLAVSAPVNGSVHVGHWSATGLARLRLPPTLVVVVVVVRCIRSRDQDHASQGDAEPGQDLHRSLGIVGGCVGTLAGIGASYLVRAIVEYAFPLHLPITLDSTTIGSGFVIGLSTALIFGLLPFILLKMGMAVLLGLLLIWP